jgi:hypothetical protein
VVRAQQPAHTQPLDTSHSIDDLIGDLSLDANSSAPASPTRRCSLYLLYWYKSTTTDAALRRLARHELSRARGGGREESPAGILALLVQKY